MNNEEDYIRINRENWNKRLDTHLASDFYKVDEFKKGISSLNAIELELLGDVRGKKILHLQCHFGQDSISLARMGAKVTGVDLSDKAISTANQLAKELKADCNFICCDLYSLEKHLNEKFDIVFASYGTIGWLPDLQRWAALIGHYLKPGGEFIFAEFHPVVWMFDYDFSKVAYRYFKDEAIIEQDEHTYADKTKKLDVTSVSWNHAMSEVIQNLLNAGLSLKKINEYDYSPYNCFKNMVEFEKGKFRIMGMDNKLPLIYSLKMTS